MKKLTMLNNSLKPLCKYSNMNRKELLKISIEAALDAGWTILQVYGTAFDVSYKEDNSPLTMADQAAHEVIMKHLIPTEVPVLSEEGSKLPFTVRKAWDRLWIVDPLDGTKEFVKRNGEFTVNIALVENGIPVMGVIYCPVNRSLYFADAELQGSWKTEIVCTEENKIEDLDQFVDNAVKLPLIKESQNLIVCASRSHMNEETNGFIDRLKVQHGQVEFISRGSSLKLCMVAEGMADVYPRYAPTMEWDIAAGHAVITNAGGYIVTTDSKEDLVYNKENLLNPWFIAASKSLKTL